MSQSNQEKFDEMVKVLDAQHASKTKPVTIKTIILLIRAAELFGEPELDGIYQWAETWKVPPKGLANAIEAAEEALLRQHEQSSGILSGDAVMAKLNAEYAFVQHGGSSYIVNWQHNADFDREGLVRTQEKPFKTLMDKDKTIDVTAEGGKFFVGHGSYWLKNAMRRTYKNGFMLDPLKSLPGFYNMWRGYSVVPVAGDWSLMRAHIRENVADGVPEYFEYIIKWFAWMFQNPCQMPRVALVLRGKKGTGKGIVGSEMFRMWGSHGMQVTQKTHVTGKFNHHLAEVIFLFADEALFAGDRADGGVLKGLITEDTMVIEGKGVNAYQARSRLHIMMSTNEEWAVQASEDERRFAVFDVSDRHMQDFAYFDAITAQMVAGGRAAMIWDLQHMDITGFNPMKFPDTDALKSQRSSSMRGVRKWFKEILERGTICHSIHPELRNWPADGWLATERLYHSYEQFESGPYKESRETMGRFLKDVLGLRKSVKRGVFALYDDRGSLVRSDGKLDSTGQRPRVSGYYILDREAARKNFERKMKVKLSDDGDEETGDGKVIVLAEHK